MYKPYLAVILTALILAVPWATAAEEQQAPPLYAPGVGLLEVYKTESPDMIPHMEPALKVPWMHDLVCKAPDKGDNIWQIRSGYQDAFLVPECAPGLGATPGSEYSLPYVAQITFYYEAKEPGNYIFSVWHGQNSLTLTIGDFLIANLSPQQPSAQGMCEFKQGFYRAVLWLVSDIYSGNLKKDPYFEVKVTAPNAPAAVIVSRSMIFVKADELPGPWRGRK